MARRLWVLIMAFECLLSLAHGVAYDSIDLSGFRDGIKHWNDKYGRDHGDVRLESTQIVETG